MKTAIFFDESASSWTHLLFLQELKKYLLTSEFENLLIAEVSPKEYLREEFLLTFEKNYLKLLYKPESSLKTSLEKASEEVKTKIRGITKILVIGSESEVTIFFAESLSKKTGAQLYIYPFSRDHGLIYSSKAVYLASSGFGEKVLKKSFHSVKRIKGFLSPKKFASTSFTPCPPARFAVFIDSPESLKSFRPIIRAVSRIESASLWIFGPPEFRQKALDYAELIGSGQAIVPIEASSAEEICKEMKKVNAVISLSLSLFPADAVFGLLTSKPVVAFEESPASEISAIMCGFAIPIGVEESIYDSLNKFVFQHDLLNLEEIEEISSELLSLESFLNSL